MFEVSAVILCLCILTSAMSGHLVAEESNTSLRHLVENQGKMLEDQSKEIQTLQDGFRQQIQTLQDEVRQLKQDACK